MPTGIGNRKVLTPRSSKNPRRSLPPQVKLIEAASFESFDDQPSSPDIMTTKLMEKVKNNNVKKTGESAKNSSKGSNFNQRLTAAATKSSNTLASNAGRSKLSTEEFNLDDDDRKSRELKDKYKKNDNSKNSSGYNTSSAADKKSSSYNTNNNNSYNSSSNKSYTSASYDNYADISKKSYNTDGNNNYADTSKKSHNYADNNYNNFDNNSYNNSGNYNNSYINTSNSSYISSKSQDYNSTLNNSRIGAYSKPQNPYSDISNNSFDRWNNNNNSNMNVMTSFNGSESVELIQEQLNHLRKEYDGLKQRFTDLSRLRLSEPEEMLGEHKKLSELRDQAAEKTIKSLQKENEELKKQLTIKNNEKSVEEKVDEDDEDDNKIENVKNNENDVVEDENFMEQVEKILKIYSSFSGLKITPSPLNPLTNWHCEFSSRSGRFNFQLIYESELNRYQYVPINQDQDNDDDEERVKNLPQFLSTDILITADQMQIFFWRLLDTLSKKQH